MKSWCKTLDDTIRLLRNIRRIFSATSQTGITIDECIENLNQLLLEIQSQGEK